MDMDASSWQQILEVLRLMTGVIFLCGMSIAGAIVMRSARSKASDDAERSLRRRMSKIERDMEDHMQTSDRASHPPRSRRG